VLRSFLWQPEIDRGVVSLHLINIYETTKKCNFSTVLVFCKLSNVLKIKSPGKRKRASQFDQSIPKTFETKRSYCPYDVPIRWPFFCFGKEPARTEHSRQSDTGIVYLLPNPTIFQLETITLVLILASSMSFTKIGCTRTKCNIRSKVWRELL
jgi:hypothetical protein